MTKPITIKTDALTKTFGDFVAVDHISLEVREGGIFGLLGANGAGKTTLMRMLCGLLKPTAGSAHIAGYDIYKQTEDIKKHIGYMSQKFSLFEHLTVQENLYFFGGVYGLSSKEIDLKINDLVQKLGITDQLSTRVDALPLGWKQKIAFVAAILHEPKIVFLDEPTGGVDPITRRDFWDLIYDASDRGTSIVVTTHYMDEAEYCNQMVIMVDGKVKAYNTPEALKQQYGLPSIGEVFYHLAKQASRK